MLYQVAKAQITCAVATDLLEVIVGQCDMSLYKHVMTAVKLSLKRVKCLERVAVKLKQVDVSQSKHSFILKSPNDHKQKIITQLMTWTDRALPHRLANISWSTVSLADTKELKVVNF